MRSRGSRILVVGTVVSVCWVLFVTQAMESTEAVKLVAGMVGLFLVFACSICLFLANTTQANYWEVPARTRIRYQGDPAAMQEREYLRRRAEDARMRDLMNPSGQQAPPTDRWYGR